MNDEASGALARVARGIGGTEVIDRLAALSGSDFASVMLEVVRRRADRETPASVLRRYKHDRFVRPGGTSWRASQRAEDILLGCLPADVEVVTLAPLLASKKERLLISGYGLDRLAGLITSEGIRS